MKFKSTPIAAAAALLAMNTLITAQAQQAPAPALDSVVVTGIRASREASINQKRNADSIVEVISAEDIGKLPDKNVADAVQRIPGVNISSGAGGEGGFSENDRVSIRGTSASLTQTLINGHAVGTGDWFVLNQTEAVGRSVSYSLLPSEIVNKVTVYKSAQADIPEGGVSGAVDIETRRPLSFKQPFTAEISAQALYSSLADKTDPQINALFNWKNAAGNAGALFQVFSETRSERRDGQEFLGYTNIQPDSAAALSNPALANVMYPQYINSSLFTQQRVRKGGMFDVELKPTSDLTVDVNGFYSRMSATNFDHSFLANTQALIEGGDIPMNTVVRNNTLVQADFPNAGGANSPGEIDSIARPGAASETWYFDINSKLHLNDAVTIKTKLGTTRGLGETPGDLGYETVLPSTGGMNYSMHGMGAPANVSFPGVNTTDFGQASLLGSWWDVVRVVDREHYAQADADWQLDAGYLESAKFGVRFTDHLRQVSWPTHGGCGFDMAAVPCVGTADWNGAQYPADFGKGFGAGAGTLPGMWLQDINSIQNYILTHGAPLEPNHVGEFSVGERTTAGYGLLNLAGDKWRGNVGARIVRTQQTVNFNVRPDENAPDEFTPVTDDRTYTDVLPSANVRLELSKNLVSRFSVARTLTRPDYSALAGAITSLDPLTKSGGGGNVDLQPVRSTNYDATLEWYFAPKSALTLGVFYMDMASYVGYGTSTHLLPNPLHANAIEEFKITSPINVKAENKGVELGYQQSLGGGFGLSANYTYADGKDADGQPLVGSSKQTYNLETYFENDAWSARMAYTQRSDYLVGLDRSTSFWAASTGNLAASVNYKINQHLSIQFDALNLNSPVLKYYGDNQDQPRAFYANGQQFFLGLRASL